MKKIFYTLAVAALAALVCTTSAAAALYGQWADFELQVVSLVNIQREHNGSTALTPDDRLQRAAYLHSEDMALNDYFSHTSLTGTTHRDRIRAQGYDYTGYPLENIAYGYMDPLAVMYGTNNLSKLSAFDVRLGNDGFSDWNEVGLGWSKDEWKAWDNELEGEGGWMGSNGHRETILHDAFTDIGVGYYYLEVDEGDLNPHYYWTQTFANGDSAPVPIPPSVLLFGSGMMWIAGLFRFKRK